MPDPSTTEASYARLLARQIDEQGYVRVPGALSAAELAQLREFTDCHAARHPDEYFAYHGEKALADSVLARLWSNPQFKALLADLYRLATGHESPSQQIFPVLRCIQGQKGRRESNCFHFDASLVTALVPIYIPQQGQERGDLMLFPNARGVRRPVLLNVIQKALLQNRLSRWLITRAIRRRWLNPLVLTLTPGDIYLFWGYRSLHANQPCSPGLKRATAILHFGDPHSGSRSTRLMLRLNQRRASRANAQTYTHAVPALGNTPAQDTEYSSTN